MWLYTYPPLPISYRKNSFEKLVWNSTNICTRRSNGVLYERQFPQNVPINIHARTCFYPRGCAYTYTHHARVWRNKERERGRGGQRRSEETRRCTDPNPKWKIQGALRKWDGTREGRSPQHHTRKWRSLFVLRARTQRKCAFCCSVTRADRVLRSLQLSSNNTLSYTDIRVYVSYWPCPLGRYNG